MYVSVRDLFPAIRYLPIHCSPSSPHASGHASALSRHWCVLESHDCTSRSDVVKPLVQVQIIFGQSVCSVHEPALAVPDDEDEPDGDGDELELELLAVVGPPLAVPVHVAW